MKKISLFIAMSLDGYIADSKGGVEWLAGQGNDDFTSYVVTHKPQISSDKIRFVNENPVELIKRLREKNGKGIWIWYSAF